jgi:glycosyltransferase involved in cell wall biosynthesis
MLWLRSSSHQPPSLSRQKRVSSPVSASGSRSITNLFLLFLFPVYIVVLSRLAYRKGIDLLVATAPRICSAFPNVKFIVGKATSSLSRIIVSPKPNSLGSGGDGPKLNDLLQVRERHLLQDRIELLGPVRHRDVRDVSRWWTNENFLEIP